MVRGHDCSRLVRRILDDDGLAVPSRSGPFGAPGFVIMASLLNLAAFAVNAYYNRTFLLVAAAEIRRLALASLARNTARCGRGLRMLSAMLDRAAGRCDEQVAAGMNTSETPKTCGNFNSSSATAVEVDAPIPSSFDIEKEREALCALAEEQVSSFDIEKEREALCALAEEQISSVEEAVTVVHVKNERREVPSETYAPHSPPSADKEADRDEVGTAAGYRESVAPDHIERSARFAEGRGLEMLQLVRHKIAAAAYTLGGRDYNALLRQADKSHSGGLKEDEFLGLARRVLRIAPSTLTDAEVLALFRYIDRDRTGSIELDNLMALDQESEEPLTEEHLRPATRGRRGGEVVTSSSSSSPPPNSSPHTSDASVLSAVSSGGDVMANYLPEGDENYRLMTPGVSLRSGPSRATSGGSSSSRDGNYRLMTPGVSLRSGSSRATSGGSSSSRDVSPKYSIVEPTLLPTLRSPQDVSPHSDCSCSKCSKERDDEDEPSGAEAGTPSSEAPTSIGAGSITSSSSNTPPTARASYGAIYSDRSTRRRVRNAQQRHELSGIDSF
jgi:hypothetical protein